MLVSCPRPLGGEVEATQGLHAAHLSLVKGKDKATHVCLERVMLWV
jgi:hypothetical protein